MRRSSGWVGLSRLEEVVESLGISSYVEIRDAGNMFRVDVNFDPLERERKELYKMRVLLTKVDSNHETIKLDLIKQLEMMVSRTTKLVVKRSIVGAKSVGGLSMAERELIKISREIEQVEKESKELKRLIRSILSYVKAFMKNT